ncbi:MAG: hypothetical protein U0804_09855 [Gemmataceae bacterium]
MDITRLVRSGAIALPVVFAAGFGVTFLMKLQHVAQHAGAEEERRPRSLKDHTSHPDWFRSLDRDSDGRVTRAEFVGTDETFRVLDGGLDGVITPAVACAADGWFRRQITGEPRTP